MARRKLTSEPSLSPRKAIPALAAALATALVLRILAFVSLGRDPAVAVPILDAQWSLDQAAEILSGRGWGAAPFFMAPLYPHLLAPVAALTSDPATGVRALQLVAGLATWLLAVGAAWRKVGPGAAVAAGWLLALAGPPLLYENLLLVDPWLALLLTALLWFDPAEGTVRRPAVAGALAALAALGRASYLLIGPLIWLRILLASGAGDRGKRLGAAVAAWALLLAPVAIQNAATGAPGTLVSTNGGINLYLGFHDGSRGGFHKTPELLFAEDPTGQRAASAAEGRSLSPAETSRYWTGRAVSWIAQNPGKTLALEIRKLAMWLGSREQPQIEVFPVLRARHGPLRWAPLHFGWFLALAALGFAAEARGARRGALWRGWGWWAGLLLVCCLTSLATFSVGRFRLPAWALLSLPAGVGVKSLVTWAREGRRKALVWGLALVALVLIATSVFPSADMRRAAAHFHRSLAQRDLEAGEPQRALEELDRAATLDADLPLLDHTRGVALARLGRDEEAIRAYRESLARVGPHPKTLQNLGALYGKSGRHEEALRYLREAARMRPDDPGVLADLGVALWNTGSTDAAKEVWNRALRINPGDQRILQILQGLPAEDSPRGESHE